MDARGTPRQPNRAPDAAEAPPLTGEALRQLHNARVFGAVIARLLAQSDKDERAVVRRELIRRAAALMPPASLTSRIREVHARLVKLSTVPQPVYLDGGTSDGVLGVVLLVSSGKAPSESTVQRALCELHTVGGSDAGLL